MPLGFGAATVVCCSKQLALAGASHPADSAESFVALATGLASLYELVPTSGRGG